MPYKVAGAAGFQAFISGFTVDSLFASGLEEETFAGWFNATEVPSTSTVQLNTGTLNKFLPGISKKYGAAQPCNVHA